MTADVTVKQPVDRDYMGDGVYATFDGFQIKLTAENGIEAHDTIYLEPFVLYAVIRYAIRCGIIKETASGGT